MQKDIVNVENELIPLASINVPDLFTNRELVDSLLLSIDKKAREHDPDLSTVSSRKKIASNASKVSKSKTFLDGLGKEFVSGLKAKAKVTDELRKLIRDTLDTLRDEVRQPLTDCEREEQERIEREAALAQYLEDWDAAISENDLIDRQREIERREAELARQEAERKAKEEAERLERERKEREERIAKEAAERAIKAAEESARREQERIECEKRDAEERAAQAERDLIAAIEKEQERLSKEAADRAEAERKAKHKAHRKRINNAALACFEVAGIEPDMAKQVITLIAEGKIDYISINY